MRFLFYRVKYILILLLIVSVSCSHIPRRYIISQKKMVNVLVDIHLADGMAEDNMRRENTYILDSASLYGSVFRKYGVTRAQFDSTMNYYSQHPDDFQKMYNKVTAKLKRLEDGLKAEIEKAKNEEKTEEKEAGEGKTGPAPKPDSTK